MAGNAITQTPPGHGPQPPRIDDLGPSPTRADDLTLGRVIGLASGCLALFGGLILLMNWFGRDTWIGPTVATLSFCIGLVGLLFHAAYEGEMEIRRIYLFGGYGLLALGVLFTPLPYKETKGAFFGLGYLLMILGLVFQVAVLRNENDAFFRTLTQRVLLGAGGLMAVIGLLGGFLFAEKSTDFLLPYGLLLALLGLFYLVACVGVKGIGDDLSYWIGMAIGGLGVFIMLLTLLRCLAPGVFHTGSKTFLLPWGLLLLGLGVTYGLTSLGVVSDNRLVVMTRRELATFFFSPVAYLVLFVFTITNGIYYFLLVNFLAFKALTRQPVPEPILQLVLEPFYLGLCTVFIVPILTMRLLSEENRTGTLEVMLTAPVDEIHVVLSKFVSALMMFLMMWVPLGLLLIALRIGGGPFDYQPLMSFFIMLLFCGAHFVALGLFFSSLSRNQIISAVLAFAAMLTMYVVVWFLGQSSSPTSRTILEHVSFYRHWEMAAQGKLLPRHLLFHASMAILWLFATVKVLESRKWK